MRGGKRPGAGRPKDSTMPVELKRKVFNVRLPAWICKWLTKHPESSGRLIERALIMTYDIKEPKNRKEVAYGRQSQTKSQRQG